jgi:hypothetical protein
MVESAALLIDEVFPEVPVRQWVLSVYRAIAAFLIKKAEQTQA